MSSLKTALPALVDARRWVAFATLVGLAATVSQTGARADEPDAETRAGWARMAESGSGFVVWESSRTGLFRIWRRELDGSGLRQLVADEAGRNHSCPHISPDGARLVYLSCPEGRDMNKTANPLHLIQTDGSNDRVIVPEARAYGGDRAVVWFDDQHLSYIDAAGFTQELDLTTGKSHRITAENQKENGVIINRARTFATVGYPPTFSPFDANTSKSTPQAALPGCEPYFTHDGQWGFWMGGAGGPINRFKLATREISPIMQKDDPRMPKQRAYMYFPMISRDARYFAFGASPNQHDHDKSDYDIFVARLNPETLEVIDRPVRYTFDPATDRYPDVFAVGLQLGRHAGEAPLTVQFSAPEPAGEWHWDFGDGQTVTAAAPMHRFESAGTFRVAASRDGHVQHGIVQVEAPRPPRAIVATLTNPTEIVVPFDEPIQLQEGQTQAQLDSGIKVVGLSVSSDARKVILKLADRLAKADSLQLSGVADLASPPNVMSPQRLSVSSSTWPVNRNGLVYLMQTLDAPNQIKGSDGKARSYTLRPRGAARPNHDQAMVLARGSYLAEGAGIDLLESLRSRDELTVEAFVRPDRLQQQGPARIVTFSSSALSRNFTLGQQADHLIFRLRTSKTDLNGVMPEVDLGPIADLRAKHVVVTYRPGDLRYYSDGQLVHRDDRVHGDFSNWSEQEVLFGDELNGERNWSGTLEGVAVFNRAMPAEEVAQDFEQYRNRVAARPVVPQFDVRAKLIAKSPVPTLEEVKPYRGAMMTCKYQVLSVLSGDLADKEVLVNQWALLDGVTQPVAALEPGAEVRLVLEPADQNPQLQSYVRKDGFDSDDELLMPRYYDVTP
jgi:hypothetical protein